MCCVLTVRAMHLKECSVCNKVNSPKLRCEQGSNLRGETPLDFKSTALTSRPSQLTDSISRPTTKKIDRAAKFTLQHMTEEEYQLIHFGSCEAKLSHLHSYEISVSCFVGCNTS